ncbi:MAG: hypothetical protein ACREGD_04150 [Candidatus Saccharimonadales bacterium]
MSAKARHNSANANGKDVIYIDVEEEITAIIDKLQASPQKIVALVLPKRAAAFQSVVNMKLLKRSADRAKKNLVLITSDPNLLPLVGGVGLHAAKNLQSKPEVPDAPELSDAPDTIEETGDVALDKSKTLAELNGDEDETIELGDEDEEAKSGEKSPGKKGLKNSLKKFRVPNFAKFRLRLLLGGGGAVALVVLGFLAFSVLPKARVVVITDSMSINISQDVRLKVGEGVAVDVAQSIVPAKKQEQKKTAQESSPATGQQNTGEKATGSVALTAKDCTSPFSTPGDVPAGSGVATGGKTYITQKKTSFSLDSASGGCVYFKSGSVNITAQSGGANYNVSSANFTVAGRSDVTGTGSASGGTDNIEKVLSQGDIDAAKQKLTTQDTEAVKAELEQSLSAEGYTPIVGTFASAVSSTKQSASPGDKVENVTVTEEITYSMLGVKAVDFEGLAAEQVKAQIDAAKQSVTDYGLDEAVFTLLKPEPDGATIGFQTTVLTGSELKEDEIKQQVAGKKANEAKELIKAYPGVTDVQVTYSPFWVSSIPKKQSKITVVIEEPQTTSDDSSNGSQ